MVLLILPAKRVITTACEARQDSTKQGKIQKNELGSIVFSRHVSFKLSVWCSASVKQRLGAQAAFGVPCSSSASAAATVAATSLPGCAAVAAARSRSTNEWPSARAPSARAAATAAPWRAAA